MSETTRAPYAEIKRWPWRDVVEAHAMLDALDAVAEIRRRRAP